MFCQFYDKGYFEISQKKNLTSMYHRLLNKRVSLYLKFEWIWFWHGLTYNTL